VLLNFAMHELGALGPGQRGSKPRLWSSVMISDDTIGELLQKGWFLTYDVLK